MRPRHLNLALVFAALILWAPGAVVLGDSIDEESRRIGFEAADSDGDGRLDEAEIAADTAAAFSALDADGDYRLDQDEVGAIGTNRFEAIDDDGDGKLTFNEVMNEKLEDIEEADKDKDGSLSIDEVRQYEESQQTGQR